MSCANLTIYIQIPEKNLVSSTGATLWIIIPLRLLVSKTKHIQVKKEKQKL